jgi:hypothetical protein
MILLLTGQRNLLWARFGLPLFGDLAIVAVSVQYLIEPHVMPVKIINIKRIMNHIRAAFRVGGRVRMAVG